MAKANSPDDQALLAVAYYELKNARASVEHIVTRSRRQLVYAEVSILPIGDPIYFRFDGKYVFVTGTQPAIYELGNFADACTLAEADDFDSFMKRLVVGRWDYHLHFVALQLIAQSTRE
jgi:hypothetical protein